jgi:hypothetical protein
MVPAPSKKVDARRLVRDLRSVNAARDRHPAPATPDLATVDAATASTGHACSDRAERAGVPVLAGVASRRGLAGTSGRAGASRAVI